MSSSRSNITALGIGVFDGLHLGHQEILQHSSHLITFSPHPDLVLGKNNAIKLITTLLELRHYVPNLEVIAFNQEIAKLSAESFLNRFILPLSPQKIITGYDFMFGHNKEGDTEFLARWATQHNISFQKIDAVTFQNKPIKSSAIREWLKTDFNLAVKALGHSYLIQGEVIHGVGRGKRLGFPTANLKIPAQKCLPATGVYKASVEINGRYYDAMAYIGNKPTFGDHEIGLEVYILNYDNDLYNQKINVFLEYFVRPDTKFESKEALVAQINADIAFCSGKKAN